VSIESCSPSIAKASSSPPPAWRERSHTTCSPTSTIRREHLNQRVFQLAEELSLPVLATNDAHFLTRDDHDAHDVLLCIGLGKDYSDTNRMHYDEGLYFKSAPEIADAFPGRKDVLENSLRIADESAITFSKQYRVPSFPLPSGIETENELLVRLAEEGAVERYGSPLPANVRERLDYELGVVTSTGYAGYFLIVADFIKAAREKGIPVGPGRGSAAGSLVAYSLRITDVCPLKFDLLFERFLNPERVSTRSACRCPTSTSTSASSGAAKSSSTSGRSTDAIRSARSSPSEP